MRKIRATFEIRCHLNVTKATAILILQSFYDLKENFKVSWDFDKDKMNIFEIFQVFQARSHFFNSQFVYPAKPRKHKTLIAQNN